MEMGMFINGHTKFCATFLHLRIRISFDFLCVEEKNPIHAIPNMYMQQASLALSYTPRHLTYSQALLQHTCGKI